MSSRPQPVARGRLFFARQFQSSAPTGKHYASPNPYPAFVGKHYASPNPYPANFGKHYASPIPYPANFPAPGGGLIFFCPLFFHQGKKRGKKEGRERLSKSSPCRSVAPVRFRFGSTRRSVALVGFHLESTRRSAALFRFHFENTRRSVALIRFYFGNSWRSAAFVGMYFEDLVFNLHPIEGINGCVFL